MIYVINHLWQSTLCAAGVWLLTLAFTKNRAAIRYWLWLAASVKFLVPFSLLVLIGSQLGWHTPQPQPAISMVIEQIGRPFTLPVPVVRSAATPSLPGELLIPFGIWLCGCTFGIIFWWGSWQRLRAIQGTATILPLNLPIKVMSSRSRLEPGVVGIRTPVLLLPEGITERLTSPQLEMVLAHELCHVRRQDNLTAALHMVVEIVFWFHPLVWWIRARLIEERERACDEEVLNVTGDPHVYAEGILNVCRFCVESPLLCASGITGSDLKQRIGKIMSHRAASDLNTPRKLLLATAAMLAVAVPFVVGFLNPSRSLAQRTPDTPTREFDAVSIKPYLPPGPRSEACNPHSSPVTFGRTGCTLGQLVKQAYNLKDYQVIVKGPAWVESDRYVIQARTTAPASEPEMMRMLQPVLIARFHLKIRWETRQSPTYLLHVASHGAKLQQATNTSHCGEVNVRENTAWADCVSIDDIADLLEQYLVNDRPVVNQTRLNKTGQFQFKLNFSTGDDPASGPSIFSALPDQLGLTLKAGKAPLQTLVIENAQRPDAN
jgi:bla regulator protein BlaR1